MATAYHTTPLTAFDPPAEHDLPAPLLKSTGHFRRSISIFSRKGAESPEPSPAFLSQAAMRQPRVLSQRQKSWMGRRKSFSDSPPSPKAKDAKMLKPHRATILHSVPPAETIHMTALEEEMASSPNEEIISAISDHAPTTRPLDEISSSLSLHKKSWKSHSTTSLTQRTKSTRRRETNTRIGEWRDGIIHWDAGVFGNAEDGPGVEDTGLIPVQPVRMGSKLGTQLIPEKPNLTVAIPGAPLPRGGEHTLPSVLQPKPCRHMPSVDGQDSFLRDSVTTTPRSVSPVELESTIELPIMKPPVRPRAPVQSGKTVSSTSRSSISSKNSNSDETALSSRCSSTTSIDDVETTAVANKNKELPPLPKIEAPHLPYIPYRPSISMRLPDTPVLLEPIHKTMRPSRSFSELEACDPSFLNTSPLYLNGRSSSPTLSQAEQDLQDQLSSIPEINKAHKQAGTTSFLQVTDDTCSSGSESESTSEAKPSQALSRTPSRAPTIPKRSRKREWRISKKNKSPLAVVLTRRRSESQLRASEHPTPGPGIRKAASVIHTDHSSTQPPSFVRPKPTRLSSRSSLSNIILNEASNQQPYSERAAKVAEEARATASAQNVLFDILSTLRSTKDLFNTAIISRGMYEVYKSHEMELLRQVTHNQSPPAWELREWNSPSEEDAQSSKSYCPQGHTPTSYLRGHRRDMCVIERLKTLILNKCQTFIRRETAFALSTPTHPNASRFNDAFWRIWCFCSIFGCNKGREDDITGQLDWLKGGLLANNQGCVATVNTNLEFEMSSVLLNPPDHFAKANEGGLTASQLIDMSELWTCMTVLLQGYQGRVKQARKCGLFDGIDIEDGDLEREEQVLEEWTYHLLTLGPAVILEMAEAASDKSSACFALAKKNGWTDWSLPLYGGSRSNFLKEPVAKICEEQVAAAKLVMQDPLERELKERSRQRVASLAAEIRVRRQSSAYKRLPYIDMGSERAMSVVSRKGGAASSRPSSRRSSGVPFTPLSPASLWSCPRTTCISPIIEERPELFSYQSFSNCADGLAEDSSERAVKRIVSMGFLPHKAREALRKTDIGDGLNIDRAVNWLLRNN